MEADASRYRGVPGTDEIDWTDPRFDTRVRLGWDDSFLYVGAELEEPHVWGTITEKNAVMFEDNDFEIFIDPDRDGLNYYEFEINALGTIYEVLFIWDAAYEKVDYACVKEKPKKKKQKQEKRRCDFAQNH